MILIDGPDPMSGNEAFPNTCRTGAHDVGCGIPIIEVSDHRNTFRIRRPDGKLHAATAISLAQVSAQLLVRASMGAFREEV